MISDMEAAAIDHEALLDTYIRAINVCTKDRPDDLTASVHMCRGNFKVLIPNIQLRSLFLIPSRVGCILRREVTTV
jgi:methionine synthase II (cobalamin-independent)